MADRPTAPESGARDEAGVGFDAVLEKLRGVVERLEAGSLTLEESLSAFEEGVRLSRRGTHILDRAEQRVEILTRAPDAPDAEPQVAPFRPPASPEEP